MQVLKLTEEEGGEGRFHDTDEIGTLALVNTLMVTGGVQVIVG